MDTIPPRGMVKIRKSYDWFLREQLEGKIYDGSIQEIKDWSAVSYDIEGGVDYYGDHVPIGAYEKEFIYFYGRMRINVLKKDKASDFPDDEYEELEDEFIGMVNYDSETLCQLRKNKFPMKLRPVDIDYFIPDDDGKRQAIDRKS